MPYQILGHRGGNEKYTENTLASFKETLDNKQIEGIELDIVVSKDKKIFIAHDRYIKIKNKVIFFHTLTYKEILKLSHSNPTKNINDLFPLFEEALILFSKYTNKIILIEVKSWPAFDHLEIVNKMLISEIHMLIRKYNLQNQCRLISFDYRVITISHIINPTIKTGLILHRNLLPLRNLVKNMHICMLIMERSWITKSQVEEMKSCNIDIFAWAPNNKSEWERLDRLGVSAIITDKPKLLSTFR